MVTDAYKTEAYKSETGQVFLTQLTISSTEATIYVVNNNEDIDSNGNTFVAFPFEIQLPDNQENSPPRARLNIDGVSQEVIQVLRTIVAAATVVIQVIRADAPDTIEQTYTPFTLRNVKWGSLSVSGDLLLENMAEEGFPSGQMTPSSTPGLF